MEMDDKLKTTASPTVTGRGDSSSELQLQESMDSDDKGISEESTREMLTLTEEERSDLSLGGITAEAENIDGEHSEDCSTCGDADHLNHEDEIEEILRNMNEQNSRYDWTTLMIRAGITTAMYPNQMAQMLMQVGYEPFPPRRSVTLLGRPCLLLPSTGGYLRYIYQVDGIKGVFRGLTPRIAHQLLFTYVFDSARCQLRRMHVNSLIAKAKATDDANATALAAGLEVEECNQSVNDNSEETESGAAAGFWDHIREIIHDLGSKLIAITVSYPLHVVVVRTVSHFVGREQFRPGIFGEIKAIYCDFGLPGFYRGLVPKLFGETCQTLAVGALAFFVSNQAPGVEVRSLLNLSFSILVSAWTYQFSVVSTTMAVNGSCLKVGNPPIQPIYDNWVQCWKELGKLNLLNRGSSIICRYYTGPTNIVNGLKVPTGTYFGPNHLHLSKNLLVK